MNYSKECLYDVRWQVLRVSLLGDSGSEQWVQKLQDYLSASDESDRAERTWRVLNLCNATLLAYGNREVGVLRERVTTLRDLCQVFMEMAPLLGRKWNWLQVQLDLMQLAREERIIFKGVQANLQKRVKTSQYKARKRGELDNVSGFKHRSELEYFLQLMERALEEE